MTHESLNYRTAPRLGRFCLTFAKMMTPLALICMGERQRFDSDLYGGAAVICMGERQ